MARGDIIVHVNRTYSTISNYHIRDKNLSLKAIGLMTKLLTMPPEWHYSIDGLTKICKECKNTIRAIIKELEDAGYVKRETVYSPDAPNTCKYVWHLYEKPGGKEAEKDTEKGGAEIDPQGSNIDGQKLHPNNIFNNKYIYKDKYINNLVSKGKQTLSSDREYNQQNVAPEILEAILSTA